MGTNLLRGTAIVLVAISFGSTARGQYGPYPNGSPPPEPVPVPYYGGAQPGVNPAAPRFPELPAPRPDASPSDRVYAPASPPVGAYPAPVAALPMPPSAFGTSLPPGAYPAPPPSTTLDRPRCDLEIDCDADVHSSIVTFTGFESFRGVADTDWQGNNGMSTGFNYGVGLSGLRDAGVGFQFGASYGVYDWNGRGSFSDNIYPQQQIFVTTGFFRKADSESNFNFGFVYDWMINNNLGIAASDGTLGQWRGQVGYVVNPHNELGIWGAARDRTFTQDWFFGPLTYRGVDQLNLFWHHKFEQGADGYFWFGVPDHTKLDGNGSLGDFILGGSISVPISDNLALYSNLTYMHPSTSDGFVGAIEESWNIGFGLAFYPGHNARTSTVVGSRWAPLLNVANNGTFMVDSNIWTGT